MPRYRGLCHPLPKLGTLLIRHSRDAMALDIERTLHQLVVICFSENFGETSLEGIELLELLGAEFTKEQSKYPRDYLFAGYHVPCTLPSLLSIPFFMNLPRHMVVVRLMSIAVIHRRLFICKVVGYIVRTHTRRDSDCTNAPLTAIP